MSAHERQYDCELCSDTQAYSTHLSVHGALSEKKRKLLCIKGRLMCWLWVKNENNQRTKKSSSSALVDKSP
ncbi:hypothetical protein CROQUDRAFT_660996 [Cronartium quercuum f. sp. fusiforme G11]|uniref:C2H2-type domain-containing protein n=1 Tax=Cronartium quercuum f. sp. fusiforme G11 TaxID=708437 RepID=A0A9P6T925_9BASI|nr:hypothetical protein CROQUDRAFT_660996 [Cronartium quercuum f. sp. fusiforme G11]